MRRDYPRTRNQYDNDSLRVVFRDPEAISPGKKDIVEELHMKFIVYQKIVLTFFVDHVFVRGYCQTWDTKPWQTRLPNASFKCLHGHS